MVDITFKATGRMYGSMNPNVSEQKLLECLADELSKIFDFVSVHDIEVEQYEDISGGYIPQEAET